MKIIWFTWKDKKNPNSGGAELVNEELAKRLVQDGHQVIFIVSEYPNCEKKEVVDKYQIIRSGSRWSVYLKARQYYKKNLSGWADLVIEEINTIPFFTKFFVKEKRILFIHQLAREIWFYQLWWPLNLIGYLLEPLYLWLLNDQEVITVSESTKKDLIRYGFKNENIKIISEGIEIEPVNNLNEIIKFEKPTILALGTIRAMKRTDEIVKAFEIAKEKINNLELIIAGKVEGKYGEKVLKLISDSKFKNSIKYLGQIGKDKKIETLRRSYILCVTSVKEGWGLTVTEAASQGTPAIVYDIDGLRDSVKNNETGLICNSNTPENMGGKIIELFKDTNLYIRLREKGWELSKKINFEKSYNEFKNILIK